VNPAILLRRICVGPVGVLRASAGGGDEGRGRELPEVDGSSSSPSGQRLTSTHIAVQTRTARIGYDMDMLPF
jgi:hypothetical protein